MEDRIIVNPKIMLGKPVIKGTRITVEVILEKLAAGFTKEEILLDYPRLTEKDVHAVLEYASKLVRKLEPPKYAQTPFAKISR